MMRTVKNILFFLAIALLSGVSGARTTTIITPLSPKEVVVSSSPLATLIIKNNLLVPIYIKEMGKSEEDEISIDPGKTFHKNLKSLIINKMIKKIIGLMWLGKVSKKKIQLEIRTIDGSGYWIVNCYTHSKTTKEANLQIEYFKQASNS